MLIKIESWVTRCNYLCSYYNIDTWTIIFYKQTCLQLKMVIQSTPIIQLVQAAEVAGLGTYPTHEFKPNLFLLPLGYMQQQS